LNDLTNTAGELFSCTNTLTSAGEVAAEGADTLGAAAEEA
jgi:hypothetical protein